MKVIFLMSFIHHYHNLQGQENKLFFSTWSLAAGTILECNIIYCNVPQVGSTNNPLKHYSESLAIGLSLYAYLGSHPLVSLITFKKMETAMRNSKNAVTTNMRVMVSNLINEIILKHENM